MTINSIRKSEWPIFKKIHNFLIHRGLFLTKKIRPWKNQSVLKHPVKQFPWRKKWWKKLLRSLFWKRNFYEVHSLKIVVWGTVLQQCFRGKYAIKKIKKMRLHICISFYDGQTVQKIFLLDMHEKCSHLFVIKGWVSLEGRFLIEKRLFHWNIIGLMQKFPWNWSLKIIWIY